MVQIQNGTLRLSATDLVGYLNCRHLTQLEHAAARGELARPKFFDPALEALWERGKQHELAYVDHLRAQSLSCVVIDGVDISEEAVAQTIAAMRAGSLPIFSSGIAARKRRPGGNISASATSQQTNSSTSAPASQVSPFWKRSAAQPSARSTATASRCRKRISAQAKG